MCFGLVGLVWVWGGPVGWAPCRGDVIKLRDPCHPERGSGCSGLVGIVGWVPCRGRYFLVSARKYPKKGATGEALGSSLSGLGSFVGWVARLEAALP